MRLAKASPPVPLAVALNAGEPILFSGRPNGDGWLLNALPASAVDPRDLIFFLRTPRT